MCFCSCCWLNVRRLPSSSECDTTKCPQSLIQLWWWLLMSRISESVSSLLISMWHWHAVDLWSTGSTPGFPFPLVDSILDYSVLVLFAFVVRFSFFSATPRDWLGRTSVTWPEWDVKADSIHSAVMSELSEPAVSQLVTCDELTVWRVDRMILTRQLTYCLGCTTCDTSL